MENAIVPVPTMNDFLPTIPVAPVRITPKLKIMQGMSPLVTDGKAVLGQWAIDFQVAGTPPITMNNVRVMLLGYQPGRIFFDKAEDSEEGKILCASDDGVTHQPQFNGRAYEYPHPGKDGLKKIYNVGATCDGCIFSQWRPQYERDAAGKAVIGEDGKPVGKRDPTTGKAMQNPPMCQENPKWALYLVDYGITAVLQTKAPFVRRPLVGLKRASSNLPGLVTMFVRADPISGQTVAANLFEDGFHPVVISSTIEKAGKGKVAVPALAHDKAPLDEDQLESFRIALSDWKNRPADMAYGNDEDDDFDFEDEFESQVAAQVNLGSGGGERRMGGSTVIPEDPF